MPRSPHPKRDTWVARYEDAASFRQIAITDGVCESWVRRCVHEDGAQVRPRGMPKRKPVVPKLTAEEAEARRLAGRQAGTAASLQPDAMVLRAVAAFESRNRLPGAGPQWLQVRADAKRRRLYEKLRIHGLPAAVALAEALR